MSKAIAISPEGLDVANKYLEIGSIDATAKAMCISPDKVVDLLNKTEVKRYVDSVYLDMGYRNRNKIAEIMGEMIESKLEEARDSEIYSSKDLADLLQMQHKMRMDEIKVQNDANNQNIKNQTNVQINDAGFGVGNYGKLMEKLLKGAVDVEVINE
jgi:molybdenum cofactor biosynthesis enzyme